MPDVVNFEDLTSFLNHASLHEIYRISQAISNELENPKRISLVKKQLKIGQVIEFLDAKTNQTFCGTLISKDIKYFSLKDEKNMKLWKVPYFMLNVNARRIDFCSQKKGLSRNELRLGQWVGFDNNGEEITGQIERLNPKTVTLKTKDNRGWRVPYQFLHQIIEGEANQTNTILISQT